jgi:tartrate dehydrogenase/decarboxylase/D-malate dehydrogenase
MAPFVGRVLAPSANLNPERTFPSLFEPIHDSAPDIAGGGVANPAGAIWVALMLDQAGYPENESRVLAVLEDALASGTRTRDPGATATAEKVTAAVIRSLQR